MDIIPSLASSSFARGPKVYYFCFSRTWISITENILLIITFVGSAILLAFPSLSKSKNSGLSPAEVVIQVNDKDAQLVDVRTPNEYSKGSLAGAVNIPAADLVSRMETLDKNRPVILVTQNGRRAQQELKQFKSKGFSDVYVLEGGLVAWQAAKLPLTGLEINRRSNKKKKSLRPIRYTFNSTYL